MLWCPRKWINSYKQEEDEIHDFPWEYLDFYGKFWLIENAIEVFEKSLFLGSANSRSC